MKKKKVEHTPAISTESILPWQIESVVEVPYIDLSSDVPQIHTFGSVQTECDLNVDKVETVQVKKEVVDTDSDDVIVTFVEEGFPKEVKKEPHSSSRSRQSMKLISTDSRHKEYQHRIDILAEVHRPQETRAQQSILDHNYIPQNVLEVESQPAASGGKTRQQEMKRIRKEDVNPELDVFIPPAAGGITKSKESMIYRHRDRMPGKETVMVHQTPSSTSVVGAPVPVQHQMGDRYYCDKCHKTFKDLNYFRRHMTRLCEKLTNREMLKCKYCDKLFKHENRYLDHLSTHDGKKRRQCKQCGQRFAMETQLTHHRKLYCPQRKK